MKRHPLADLALVLVLAFQGVASASSGRAPAAEVPAEPAAVPCHGGDSAAVPAAKADCCGEQCLCDLHCGALALLPAVMPLAPLVPGSHADTPRVPPLHAAYRDPRLRPPDSVPG